LVLGYLFFAPFGKSSWEPETTRPVASESVKVVGEGLIQIQTGHVIEQKLQVGVVEKSRISVPLLTVTGTVAASLRPENGQTMNWQFSALEALTAYTDWQRARNDVTFNEDRLTTIGNLVEAKVTYQKKFEGDLEKSVARGAIPEHTLNKAKLETIEAQLDGQKEIHEAKNAVRLAKRSLAAAALQLEQAGLKSEILQSATPDVDIVTADVPLGSLSYVKIGQKCKATFVGLLSQIFDGRVDMIVPVISKERRSMRALFVIHDPDDMLRPGMFADIELGTDPRDALLAPAEGIVHIGRADYYLVATGTTGVWRAAEVHIGEPYKNELEILDGLKAGDRVLGRGAILLKPVVVRSLQSAGGARPEAGR
jgi:hypothetical protein